MLSLRMVLYVLRNNLLPIEKLRQQLKWVMKCIKDLDGDNQITVKDQVNIGTTDPKLIYGVALKYTI